MIQASIDIEGTDPNAKMEVNEAIGIKTVNNVTLADVSDKDVKLVTRVMQNLGISTRDEMKEAFDEGLLTSKEFMNELKEEGAGRKAVGLATKVRKAVLTPAQAPAQAPATDAGTLQPTQGGSKRFAAFLSHHKKDSAMEARWVKQNVEPILDGREVFLDSDELQDLTKLLNYVMDSEVLVLLQTSDIIARPWMILEVHTAVTHNVPIVAIRRSPALKNGGRNSKNAGDCCSICAATANCTIDGEREPSRDLSCFDFVPHDASGYCECAGGKRTRETACEHEAFTCQKECAVLRARASASSLCFLARRRRSTLTAGPPSTARASSGVSAGSAATRQSCGCWRRSGRARRRRS